MGSITKKLKDYRGESSRLKYKYAEYCLKCQVKKNLVLFESFHGKDISDSPLAMARELIESNPGKYDIYFASVNVAEHKRFVDALGLDIKVVHIHSNAYLKVLATAEYLVNNSSFPAYFIRRDGQHYLQTWHGTPLKTLGKRMRMGIESMDNVQHNFMQASLLMFPNEFTKDAMMGDYNLNDLYTGRIALCGYPRNGVFGDRAKAAEIRKRLATENISTLAYMPTWRGQNNYDIETSKYSEEVAGILNAMDEALSDGQTLYVNFHPIVQKSITLGDYKHIKSFPNDVDKYEFINSTDCLITDYSSVFFDYSITGKPIVLFMYDYDEYMNDRGMYFDIKELPFKKVYDLNSLCEIIANREYEECSYETDTNYVDRFIKYDTIDNAGKLNRLFFDGDSQDIIIEDYSANLEKSWRIVDAERVKSKAQLDTVMTEVDGENEIVMFAKRNFNPDLSSYMYDHYLEGVNYIFTVRSLPRTIKEDIVSKFSEKKKKEFHRRNIVRCFGHLNIIGERKGIAFPSAGTVTKIKTSGTVIHVEAKLKKDVRENVTGVVLKFRSDVDDIAYDFMYKVEGNQLVADIDVRDLNLDGVYWDLKVIVDGSEGEESLRLDLPAKEVNRLRVACKQCVVGDEIVFPHVSIGKQLAFTHREYTEYDGRVTRIKEFVARVIAKLFGSRIRRRKIWLVFEKFCQMAQDNGYYFFKYCMEQLPEEEKKNIYYVMKKDAADWNKVAKYKGHVIKFMSIRHMVYAMTAGVYVGSDSKKHLYVWRAKPSHISEKIRVKKILFLQHGVTALKRVDGIFGAHGSSPMTHFTTTSEYEQKIIVDNFGYSEENAPILGFTRWDVLEDTSREDDRLILVMPTWRSWLEERTAEEFKLSDYYENYMKLFTDPKLEEILDKNDARMIFYIHPKFKDYLGEFVIDNARIELVPFGSRPLNAIMRDCRMLITDYSSVCWDVYYMGKPVLFYQFDHDMYERVHGSYMDMKKELFGPQYFDSESLIRGLAETIESDFAESEEAASKRDYYFKYIDNDNSRRTYEYLRKQGY